MYRQILLVLAAALMVPGLVLAQDEAPALPPLTLAELAAASDLVALVQVADTDYQYAREFPTGGTAYLRVLISYRVSAPIGEIIEVYDEGLHAHECYFENPSVLAEGRRHLVFLRDNPAVDGQFLGLHSGCALEVLVTTSNRYALRYPLFGMAIADDVAALVEPMEFTDAYAFPEDEDLTVAERNELLAAGYLERREDGRFRFTHGIELSALRQLIGAKNLTLDRAARRPVETE